MSMQNSPQDSKEATNILKEAADRKSRRTGAWLEKANHVPERNGTPILEVKDLCYRYPHLDSNALDEINLKLFKGGRVAVLAAGLDLRYFALRILAILPFGLGIALLQLFLRPSFIENFTPYPLDLLLSMMVRYLFLFWAVLKRIRIAQQTRLFDI